MTMNVSTLGRVMVLAASVLLSGIAPAADEVRQLEWDDLIPPDWDPFARLAELQAQADPTIADDSAEADALMEEFVTAGRSAPVVDQLDGESVKLPGYVVPLDFEGQEVTEFLLVPYFGACIHVPPPPANQIVYVKTQSAYPLTGLFDAVWVTGTLKTQSHWNDVGDAGYTLEASAIEAYEWTE